MGLLKRLENIFAAAAFAEEGDYKTARAILEEEPEEDTRLTRPETCEGINPTPANT